MLAPYTFALLLSLAGSEISVRLQTAVSTATSKPGDAVVAVVIAPVGNIPAGSEVRGAVEKVTPPTAPPGRALLVLRFSELRTAAGAIAIDGRVAGVDNARESVGDDGAITGILPAETASGQLDGGFDRLGQSYSGLADLLRAARDAVAAPPSLDIDYRAGVELTLRLAAPPALEGRPPAPPQLAVAPGVLARLVRRMPVRSMTKTPSRPADLVNLLLAGSEEAIRKAFTEAGWHEAARLSTQSRVDTARALVEARSYEEAPVSVELVGGKPADLVFEKSNNTFAKRHHLRLWRRPGSLQGRPVWVAAATHDIDIDVAPGGKFIHRIDPRVDLEREKIVFDLLFTGQVDGVEHIERRGVPHTGRNATGDSIETDGKLAVVVIG